MPPKKSASVQKLAKAIRSVRAEHGYAQEAFAKRAGIDRSYYGAIERGEFNISFDTLVKVASGLETTAAALCRRANL
jgi:transcriptional regulator with XRE-family HTH domain